MKQINTNLETLEKMLEYHKKNTGNRTTIIQLERKINYIQTQAAAVKRERKVAAKSYKETFLASEEDRKTKPYKVVLKGSRLAICYGSLKECSDFLVTKADEHLVIVRNNYREVKA